ncbi:MAG TPA: CoA-acylating methylmalonate-semialdehyde dehydrogenase [Solirubrobacteraceae bacterium]|jgi:malonate-semialdehyde dehydrogenase (acetylating)/methylmalonate-semialdehyde dehydrogenase|nr:CoA-acylating methylmalonate-semialdehyde dehydrogenase [Solirubrobacteraceae bacterium]
MATTETLLPHWIEGREETSRAERYSEVTNSATGEVVARVPFADAEEVDAAVQAAVTAAPAWETASLSERTRIMFAFRELLHARSEEMARIVSLEHGKVADDARGEVQRELELVEFACGLSELLKGEHSWQVSRGTDSYTLRQPVGVVAGITPFNFPSMVPGWMFPLAIAAGNTFVLKPSEQDPSASMMLAELLAEAGLPSGVFNVVHGDREAVDALLTHPRVNAVSFVGSTPVARHVHHTAMSHGKRAQALGGAKNHAVVLADSDLDYAADQIVAGAYGSSGQRCMAVSAVVAVGGAGDALVEKLGERLDRLVVGPGDQPASEVGPLISAAARDRVRGLVDAGVEEGAELVRDGRDVVVDGHEGGFFIGPCLFDRVSREMRIYREEIFGPVLVVTRAGSLDEAIALINANPWGNGAAIFTRDGGAARAFQLRVSAGMVGINVPIPVPMSYYSFGGWKASLFGDMHMHGPEGVRFYTRGKVVTSRWPDAADARIDLAFPTAT